VLLQPKGNTDPKERFHVPSGMGKAMIAAGIAEEYLPPAKPWQPTAWTVGLGAMQGMYPPIIHFNCPNCAAVRQNESNKGTAHTNDCNVKGSTAPLAYMHCNGLTEEIPESVSREYQKLWLNWRKEFQPKLLAKEQREREMQATRAVAYMPTRGR
jgi:hypothetical protein